MTFVVKQLKPVRKIMIIGGTPLAIRTTRLLPIYLLIFVLSSIIIAVTFADFEHPLLTAEGAVATTLGNVHPSIGELGLMIILQLCPLRENGSWLFKCYWEG